MNQSSSQDQHVGRIFGLDVIRAAAIAVVLLSHIRFFVPEPYQSHDLIIFIGFLGVEAFFVLSGFLIGGILFRDLKSYSTRGGLLHFWCRRWFRTLPNYYLFLTINWFLVPFVHRQSLDWKFVFFLQNLLDKPYAGFWESWSLAVEEWFYLLFPLALFLLTRLKVRLNIVPVVGAVIFLFGITWLRFWWVTEYPGNWYGSAVKVVVIRLDSVMYGVLGAYLQLQWGGYWSAYRKPCAVLSGLLFALLLVPFFLLERDESIFMKSFYLSFLSLSLLLALPFFEGWRSPSNRHLSRMITSLSIWSYSLYLCHLPLQKIFFFLFTGLTLRHSWVLFITIPLWLLVSIAIAKLCYEWFERPIMKLRDRVAPVSS